VCTCRWTNESLEDDGVDMEVPPLPGPVTNP
jgi:hypothetical protein